MHRFLHFDQNALPEPEISHPEPEKRVEGLPEFKLWLLENQNDKTYAGFWASSAGAWRVSYDEWEYCFLIEGLVEITDSNGAIITLKAGDHFVFQPGFSGVWRVIEPVLKSFVIVMP